MSLEAPRSTGPSQRTIEKVIDSLENDPRFLIPKFNFPDETEISDLYRSEELTASLTQAGLTSKQKQLVKIALGAVCCYGREPEKLMTVGEIRKMTDKELLLQERGGNKVGKKKLKILRALFGKVPEESDLPAPVETLSFRDLNEEELSIIKLELGERLLASWEHILSLPRVETEDEAKPGRLEELFDELRFRGLTRGQLASISGLLSEINQFTVGELRKMSDKEILELEGIGLKRWVIIRILLGQT